MSDADAQAWKETAILAMRLLCDLAKDDPPHSVQHYQDRIERAIIELQTYTLLLPAPASNLPPGERRR